MRNVAEGVANTRLERFAVAIAMVWLAIWSSVGYVMILWMRSQTSYHFRIPIAHSHGLLFTTLFLIGVFAMMKSQIPVRLKQGLIGLGLFTVLLYPLGQLAEIIDISYLTDTAEILFVLFLLSMAYVAYKMKY